MSPASRFLEIPTLQFLETQMIPEGGSQGVLPTLTLLLAGVLGLRLGSGPLPQARGVPGLHISGAWQQRGTAYIPAKGAIVSLSSVPL